MFCTFRCFHFTFDLQTAQNYVTSLFFVQTLLGTITVMSSAGKAQKAWNTVTHSLTSLTRDADVFNKSVSVLVTEHSLDDVLLKCFFGAARLAFKKIAIQFQTIIAKKEDPDIIVIDAIRLANTKWMHWYQTGLDLSAAISRAQALNADRDYTTEQLRASFNVAMFEPRITKRTNTTSTTITTTTAALFAVVVEKYFRSVFNETHRSAGYGLSEEDNEDEDGDNKMKEASDSTSSMLMETFSNVCAQLRSLCWVNRLEPACTSVLYEKLETHIEEMCKGEFEEPLLLQLDDWMEKVALRWLRIVHAPTPTDIITNNGQSGNNDGAYLSWRKRLNFHLYTTFGKLRIRELFDIIKNYPDTEPAIVDLRECLKRTHQHRQVTSSLRDAFERRLLHPGAKTEAILEIYVSTIKALRLLDSTGVLLESVSQAIKNYLRGREDTIRKIVEHLTNPDGGDLFRELVRDTNTLIQQADDDSDGDDAHGVDAAGSTNSSSSSSTSTTSTSPNMWMPDSIDADPSRSSRSRRLSDILSMLVQIYGSKKLFVTEYKTLLAKKLLKNTTFNTDQEVYTLERLKQRFGEAPLHPCEIMMKDLADSRRINKGITTTLETEATPTQQEEQGTEITVAPMKSIIISKEYWPKLHNDPPFNLHPILLRAHDEFAKQYSALKAPRKLRWKHNLGIVNLDLTFEDGKSYNFQVTPAHASVMLHLKDQKRWSVVSLARKVGLQETALRRIAATWIHHGVVREISDEQGVASYEVVENYRQSTGDDEADNVTHGADGEEEGDGVLDSTSTLDYQMYENYVLMMLQNFGELPLDGIHNKLTMFVMGGDQEITLPQLRVFLNKLVGEEKIAFNGQCFTIAQ